MSDSWLDAKAIATTVPAEASDVLTLQPGDKVRVTVFGEDKLSGEYDLDKRGSIAMPLAGPVSAAGLTLPRLEAAIVADLKASYLRDPKVTVDLVSVRPFYILGEVEKPGEYPYRDGLDIWRAMAVAGGQTYRASTSKVLIQRAGDPEWREYAFAAAPPVAPGDAIRVPQRWF